MLAGLPYQSFQGIVDSLARSIMCAFLLFSPAVAPANGTYPATKDHEPPAWFVDVASLAGLKVINVNGGSDSKHYILEATGSGVAIIDYDRGETEAFGAPAWDQYATLVEGTGRVSK